MRKNESCTPEKLKSGPFLYRLNLVQSLLSRERERERERDIYIYIYIFAIIYEFYFIFDIIYGIRYFSYLEPLHSR